MANHQERNLELVHTGEYNVLRCKITGMVVAVPSDEKAEAEVKWFDSLEQFKMEFEDVA